MRSGGALDGVDAGGFGVVRPCGHDGVQQFDQQGFAEGPAVEKRAARLRHGREAAAMRKERVVGEGERGSSSKSALGQGCGRGALQQRKIGRRERRAGFLE